MGRFSPAIGDYEAVVLLLFACDGAKLRPRPGKVHEQGRIFCFYLHFLAYRAGF